VLTLRGDRSKSIASYHADLADMYPGGMVFAGGRGKAAGSALAAARAVMEEAPVVVKPEKTGKGKGKRKPSRARKSKRRVTVTE